MYDGDHYFLSYDDDSGEYDDDQNQYESERPYWHDPSNPEVPITAIVKNPVLNAVNLTLSSAYETEIAENEVWANMDDLLPEVWARSEASWRRMMHSQPGSRGVVKSTIASFDTGGGCHEMAGIRFDDCENGRLGNTVDELLCGPSSANDMLICEPADSAGSAYEFGKLHLSVKDSDSWKDPESWEWPFSEREISTGEATKASAARREAGED